MIQQSPISCYEKDLKFVRRIVQMIQISLILIKFYLFLNGYRVFEDTRELFLTSSYPWKHMHMYIISFNKIIWILLLCGGSSSSWQSLFIFFWKNIIWQLKIMVEAPLYIYFFIMGPFCENNLILVLLLLI